MVMRRVVRDIATTTHHLRLRSVTRCILVLPGFRLAYPASAPSARRPRQDIIRAVAGAAPNPPDRETLSSIP
jgi:hypothetical protein